MEGVEKAWRGLTLLYRGRLTPINHKIPAQMLQANKQHSESKKSSRTCTATPMIALPASRLKPTADGGGQVALLTTPSGEMS